MTREEKEVLKKVFESPIGLLSQDGLLALIPDRSTKISHSLITSGYIEEVKRLVKATQIEVTFYRITEKGRIVFASPPERLWFAIKGDVRTIMVSVITALLTTGITIWLTNYYGK